ncbi:DUF5999 family protein [Streptomyces sp. B1866]|uniref:DUF5999 family protein n=1 Tax=Streptomyces sp. B1866 TaxID=3075431 RepID=UPI00288F999A|nr:DUF5999 family protein [Streptomyces sp. B1866]MDT3395239.1 DUF5999 family protein [Streptomyces sp. B1866]
MCPHQPPCPPPETPGREAARVLTSCSEQGWSLLCGGAVRFADGGLLLPDGRVVVPPRLTC